MNNRLDRLERLNRLRESGALSQEEFDREKAVLLESESRQALGGRSKGLLLGSVAALVAVVAVAGIYLSQARRSPIVREAEAPGAAAVLPQQASAQPDSTAASNDPLPSVPGVGVEVLPDGPGREVAPNLSGDFYEYRTRITQGWREQPNLAGEFVVIRWGCGTGCATGVIGNKRTGQLQWLGLGGEDYPYLQLRFDVDGNDVLAIWREDAYLCAVQMFQWNGRRMVAQEAPELHKTRTDDCDSVG